MLDRWAKNIVRWYKVYGKEATRQRTQFLTQEDISVADPIIKEEFKKQGYKV